MLVSYKWLQQYVDASAVTPEELAEKFNRTGIEVEVVESLNKGIKNVVVGHVLSKEQHPNADKLSVCSVDIGDSEPVQIICGAANVAAGQKVAVAKVGAVLPGNFKIKKAKLRGEESHGMICSLQELGIEAKVIQKDYATGIFVFPNDVEVGSDALEQLNLDDHVLELELTANRSDCLNMLGVAYEVGAMLGKEVELPRFQLQESNDMASDLVSVNIEDHDANPLYIAKVIKNVKVGPSPLWLQTRLMAAGIRPINNVVDITNYVLLEYGQPLHAFDYDRFGSKEVLVRRAKPGEELTTLDDVKRSLTEDDLVITNGNEPVALAGVMGGADSEVREDTTTILLEAAYFNSGVVRSSSKSHGLRSDSSARFEKGIDPKRTQEAANRAAYLMMEYAGGEIAGDEAISDTLQLQPVVVSVSVQQINRLLGTSISNEEVGSIFHNLQFSYTVDNDVFVVTVPTRRNDISIPEDLVEEVGRLYGYDNVKSTLPIGEARPGILTPYQAKRRKVRRYLEGAGLYQVVNYSLTSEEKVKQFALEEAEPVRLAMPMSEERSMLRLSLIPHLLDVVKHNSARQIEDIAIYETASVFVSSDKDALPNEKEHVAGALTGLWSSHLWQGEKKAVDFYVAKGVLDGLFSHLGLEERIQYKQIKQDLLHPGRTAQILLDGDVLGIIGQLHPITQNELDLQETYVFELSLEKLLQAEVSELKYNLIPRFPSITRDIALVVNSEVAVGDLKKTIIEAGGDLLKNVSIFDLYEGEHMEQGKKSVAFSLRYLDPERTLTDEEVTSVHENVLKAVENQFDAKLRG
ncbi:phenylalanine--tRNA ligase subunit beta [Bacillus sp. SCS-151]|uniref:phenylalanine--tRNA ligase subunit beta n=1 Tax=Nanhaiella sioensis TaxID=3115293 RepID=UPI00397E13E5